ncbi:hypothetical protein BU14_0218s0035 [Porphyra umbilicalis]|uniref:Uncharacterized protein n=1 Tax=Porphyra umbilicalis TaxID=2786 RepID=A0A1X6P4Q6_PORUM|nr:hypothetical protein BU14_0218s0035 [Porphyra umbilicalis]|eukprot:OSX75869.1 hypothetical protein BU14_0218s0035 [Porphyra umbilicalis]
MEPQPGQENDPPGMEVYGGQGAENGVYNPAEGGGGGDGAEADGSVGDGSGVEFVVLNDDVLTSVANATLVLLDGSDMERLAVLYQFPQFLEHCPSDTLGIMVPEICRDALRWKEDVQMAAAEALYFVVNMRVPDAVAKRVVVAALRILQLSESGDVFDAWGEILSMMLPQVRRDDVVTLVVPATADRAASGAVESRRLAARIIGALHDALTADELERQFLSTAITLSQDADASVRAMIAQSLASVASKLPLSVSEAQLWPRLDTMVASDPNARDRKAKTKGVVNTAVARQLAPIFESLELMSQDSWRTQELLAVQLKLGAHLVPQDTLCEHVAPLLFQMARESTYLVRKACMEALVAVMRAIPDTRRREHIVKHFRIEWARGKVYWTRLAYIDGAAAALSVFSRSAFVSMFAGELLRMTRDAVPNVRLRLVRLLVDVGPLVRSEPKLAAALDGALTALSVDSDAEVAAESREASRRIAAFRGWTKRQNAEDRSRAAAEAAFFIQKPPRRKKTPSSGSGVPAPTPPAQMPAPAGTPGAVSRPPAGTATTRPAGAVKHPNGVATGPAAAAAVAPAATAAPGAAPGAPGSTATAGTFVALPSGAAPVSAANPSTPGAVSAVPGTAGAAAAAAPDAGAGATGVAVQPAGGAGRPVAAVGTPNGMATGVAAPAAVSMPAVAAKPVAAATNPAVAAGRVDGVAVAGSSPTSTVERSRSEERPRRGGLCGCFGR